MNKGLQLNILARDSLLNILRQGFSIILGIVTSALLARGLGVLGRGQYALIILLPTFIVTFFNAGVGSATVYYVALNKYDKHRALQSNIALFIWVSLASMLAGLIIVIFFADIFFSRVSQSLLFFSLLSIPTRILIIYIQSIFQGLQDFKSYNLLSIAPQFLSLFFTVLFLQILHLGVWGAILANIASFFLTALFLFFLVDKILKPQHKSWNNYLLPDKKYTRDIFNFGLKSHFSNIVGFLNYRSDILLVNFFVGASAVGIYGVSVGIAENLWILSRSIASVIFPKVASLKNEPNKRNTITPLIARHVFIFSLLISIIIAIFSKWIILLLYGKEFQPSSITLLWLLPGIVMASVSRILANDIAGRGKPKINLVHSLIILGVNIIANIILLPKIGVRGASVATSISYSLLAIIKTGTYSKLTGVRGYSIWFPTKDDILGWKIIYKKLLLNYQKKNNL